MICHNKIKKLMLLLVFFILIACEKENKDNPKVYFFDSFETGEVRIYTKDGEIKDVQLSTSFTKKWNDYFYKKDSFEFTDFDFNSKITLNSNHQSIAEGSDTIVTYGTKQKNEVIYFESIDTSYSNFDLINMKDPRFKFGPITQTEIKEGGYGGFPPVAINYYGYLPCVYAIDEGQVIKFPFTSFLEKNCTADSSFLGYFGNCLNVNAVSNINNLFNENYLRRMNIIGQYAPTRRDTIVIQENFIVFRKQ
jgi:hypothetical protein